MKKLVENLILAAAILLTFCGFAAAQTSRTEPPVRPDANIIKPPASPARSSLPPAPRIKPTPESRDTNEKSIKVDASVNLLLGCVREGKVRVNGWNRNEIRVLVSDGNKFAFRTLQKNTKTGEPVWIKLVGWESNTKYGPNSECISADRVEIDAPMNAIITVKGLEISTFIDTVKRVDIETIGGDVSVRNISNGVKINAGRGDITVEASDGAMSLDTTTGNILVFEGGPSEIGDVFKAKTSSGAVALQDLEYRQIGVESVTGSVVYTGGILSGGSYNMRTSKGSIRMTIPANSSFQMWATYGFGNFSTEIPIDIITENITPGPIKTVRGKIGTGDATLKLTTNNGSIAVKKM